MCIGSGQALLLALLACGLHKALRVESCIAFLSEHSVHDCHGLIPATDGSPAATSLLGWVCPISPSAAVGGELLGLLQALLVVRSRTWSQLREKEAPLNGPLAGTRELLSPVLRAANVEQLMRVEVSSHICLLFFLKKINFLSPDFRGVCPRSWMRKVTCE